VGRASLSSAVDAEGAVAERALQLRLAVEPHGGARHRGAVDVDGGAADGPRHQAFAAREVEVARAGEQHDSERQPAERKSARPSEGRAGLRERQRD
jgi:hypothetical protein